MKEFDGKVAIVTGTTGIARGIAIRLASAGARVMACGIDAAANRELQRETDGKDIALRVDSCDVSRPEQVQAIIASTIEKYGGLDFFANSAAIPPVGNGMGKAPKNWDGNLAGNPGSGFFFAHF